MMRQYELVERVTRYDPDANEDLLNRAYVYAMLPHGSQKRASGDPYFSHPVKVAGILSSLSEQVQVVPLDKFLKLAASAKTWAGATSALLPGCGGCLWKGCRERRSAERGAQSAERSALAAQRSRAGPGRLNLAV